MTQQLEINIAVVILDSKNGFRPAIAKSAEACPGLAGAGPVTVAGDPLRNCITYAQRIRGERSENLERVIGLHEQVLTVHTREATPVEWATTTMSLANAYKDRIRGERSENVERAIDLCGQALTVYTLQTMPIQHRQVQTLLGDLPFGQQNWVRAAAAYQCALSAHELVFEAAATPEARLGELTLIQNVPARLSYALARQENPDLEQAAVVLEQGRARLLAEALDLNLAIPEKLTNEDWVALEKARTRVKLLESEARLREGSAERREYVVLAGELGRALAELRQIVERIRSYMPEFLPRAQFQDIVCAAQTAQLVYLAATPTGGMALSVSAEGSTVALKPIFLSGLIDEQLLIQASTRLDEQSLMQASTRLDELLRWLWDKAMEDVASLLSPERPTVLIPSGPLGFFPLHAAWSEDTSAATGRRYALDAGLITYAPSAKALIWAHRHVGTGADSILAIDEPRPVHASSLENSSDEVETAISYFEPKRAKLFRHEQARRNDVMEACGQYSVFHFACHGYANFQMPLESGLLMAYDELLNVRDLLGLRLQGVRLAVLSACETGLPGAEAPDEMIGLPAGLLQAGVAGVVGSMWSVSDASTMMLMAQFYELWRKKYMEPAAALRAAQLWVRDTTNREKAQYFKAFIPELQASAFRMASTTAERLYQNVVIEEPDGREFAHPYYWAGFSYFGA